MDKNAEPEIVASTTAKRLKSQIDISFLIYSEIRARSSKVWKKILDKELKKVSSGSGRLGE